MYLIIVFLHQIKFYLLTQKKKKKSFVAQLGSFDISNRAVWGSNLPSTIVTFELSKHKYLTFIIKFNNKMGNKNKIKVV